MFATFRKFRGFYFLGMNKTLQYRFNLFSDAIIQPLLVAVIEVVLWTAIFRFSTNTMLGNFSQEYYMAYFIWASFIARINSNWSYENEMIRTIELGGVNSVLVRPTTFYNYYLGQFLRYKSLTSIPALIFPILICLWMKLPIHYERLPVVIGLALFYMIFLYTLSFCVACLAFSLTRVQAFTGAKNIALWAFTGEMYPLDLAPEGIKQVMIALPFANGVYIPVGYLTGRFGFEMVTQGFVSLLLGILFFVGIASLMWRRGLKVYTGTGA